MGKGTHIAVNVCKHIGAELIILGTGSDPKSLGFEDGWPPNVKFLGYADVEKRKYYMSRAKGLFCPTLYTEPFGFVAIEAQLSGTPVICTDWGGFTETVLHGKTGYRCRTFEQFCWAAKNIENIQPIDCRRWSETNYNMKKIGKMYREYFESLILFSKEQKWFTNNDSRTQLDWLTKTYT
jgi:glycosyltransferase involved in cell wall biosynthesis